MGDYLSADAILGCDDQTFRDEDVPEWGGTVRVASLTGRERDAFDASNREIREDGTVVYNGDNQRAKLVARSLVDPETGKRLFTDQQINALGEKNSAALQRLYDVAAKLSGLAEDSDKEAEGNSDAAPSGDSGSTSPAS
jgi:hypothetical protein